MAVWNLTCSIGWQTHSRKTLSDPRIRCPRRKRRLSPSQHFHPDPPTFPPHRPSPESAFPADRPWPDPATEERQRAAGIENLDKEAASLAEILRNQSHPNNLAAVRKSGTPVLVTPSEGAKVLFLADAEDEFEILESNESWVHVRISGLSRAWIRRSGLEMPGSSAADDTPPDAPPAPPPVAGKGTLSD